MGKEREVEHTGCKESFTACHLGQLQLECTSSQVILTSPKTLFD